MSDKLKSVKESHEYKEFVKLSELGLVLPNKICGNENCKNFESEMEPDLRKREKNAKNLILNWRCRTCRVYNSVYAGSFFSLFRKPVKIILAVIKCWAAQISATKAKSVINLNLEHQLTEAMILGVYARLRQICTLAVDKQNLKLGGSGKVVEIDESLYCKVKHWKGKDLKRRPVWVFGLVERADGESSGRTYMQIVKDREAQTLLSIIYDKCESGSIIFSDCWASYNKIAMFKNFTHKTVNHSVNFLDPNNGACTNRIESLWRACKQKFKEMNGCKRVYIQSYIDEFIWRFNNNVTTDRIACYNLILREISKFYRPGISLNEFEEKVLSENRTSFEEDELSNENFETCSSSGSTSENEVNAEDIFSEFCVVYRRMKTIQLQ
ncbi:ISXO2-like domain-containing, partial [Brachionus plicatilis]